MRLDLAWVNGRILPSTEPSVPAADAGLLHGLGIYETLSVMQGKPVFLIEHLERMEEGRKALHIPLLRWSVAKAVESLIEASAAEYAALRITLTRGNGKVATLSITLRELPWIQGPVRLIVSKSIKLVGDPMEKIKTTCRARNSLAREEAERQGAFDALLRTHEGDYAEGTICNLFAWDGQTVLTPSLNRGVLPGVTRDKILAACRKLAIPCREITLGPRELKTARALFVSNALVGVLEVDEVIGVWKKPDDEGAGLITRLQEYYQEQIKRHLGIQK